MFENRKTENETKKEKQPKRKRAKMKKPMDPRLERAIAVLNRYSLIFHVLLACGVCFLIEWISRHSFLEACEFVLDRNLVFLYNAFLIYATLMLVYIVKRRMVARVFISFFWLFLGIINGCVLAKRVSPFSWTDLKMVGDLFTMQSSYFSDAEAALVIAGVAVVCILLVVLWLKGPKYKGKTHRLAGGFMAVVVAMLIPGVTDAAVSSNVLAEYFTNLAQGYKDNGFVYSFSASVLDTGMSAPSGYSEEAVNEVLAHMYGGAVNTAGTAQAGADTAEAAVGTAEADAGEAADTIEAEEISYATAQPSEDNSDMGAAPLSAFQNADLEKLETIRTAASASDEEEQEWEYPNIVLVLLESFVDPDLINFLETSEEPVPNFTYLYENFSSGYLEVPVVGAGTANTEFEILTGMGMQFFGLGEYPYKTILKQTNCESIASDLATLGYGSHAVHNNGGNFYSRANAFSQMGFDTFTCKELMDIRDYTPLGTWPTDDILIGEAEKSLDYTPDQQDFVYVITVEGHGDYPDYQVLEDPAITVTGAEDEAANYRWEYYVNMLHEVDDFIGDLIAMLDARGEPTLVVMFGDHLPTMGLTEEDMATGSLFLTQYVTWNNFGLEKEDRDMTSYQLMADILKQLGMDGLGTMFTFHQSRDSYDTEEEYINAMEMLQYDILYGEHYVYGGENPYPATDLTMGTQEVVIDRLVETDKYIYVIGDNFTKWSKIYLNDEKISTTYYSSTLLRFKKSKLAAGENTIVVSQVGSSNTIFRSSNAVVFTPEEETETESQTG